MDKQKFYSICLHGDILKAIDYLKSLENKSDDILKLEAQYEKRFLLGNEIYEVNSNDPWIKNVINCYYEYFVSVLAQKSLDKAESNLASSLSKLVDCASVSNLDEIEEKLKSRFEEKGYSFVGGVTSPYRGPYVWKNTIKKQFNVSLLDSEQAVTVYFISDFLLLSWIDFATMGEVHPGGWAKPEGLYYVDDGKKELDINSTEFQVCFLKHEAQHLSDYNNYPKLNARNLEYRAKLVEIIYNPEPQSLVEKFLNQSKNDISLPHPYASYAIIKQLSSLVFNEEFVNDKAQWKNTESPIISGHATKLFLQNNLDLQKAGKESEGII